MDMYRVWFGVQGEVYAGEDPACPSFWRGSGCYDTFKDKVILAVADIWCRLGNVKEKVLELIDKELDLGSVDAVEIVRYTCLETQDEESDEFIEDWHIIKESEGSMSEDLDMRDFVKSWDPSKKVYPGDVFDINGRMVEIL